MAPLIINPVQQRAERVARHLQEARADVLIAGSATAIAYVAGVNIRPFTAPGTLLVLEASGTLRLLASEADRTAVEHSGYQGNADYWPIGDVGGSGRQAVLAMYLGTFGAGSRVALEGEATQVHGPALAAILSQAESVDAAPILDAAARIKDDEELRLLREAANLADIAYTAVVDRMTPELRAYEIVRNVDRSLRSAGGGDAWSPLEHSAGVTRASHFPKNSLVTLLGRVPETGVLDPGQPLPFALYPLSRLYTGAAGTTIVFEQPSASLKSAADALSAATEAAIAAVAPGVRADEVYAAYKRGLQGAVAPERLDPVIGYSVGTGVGRPLLSAGSSDVLEPGMALSIRTAASLDGGPGIAFQSTVLVTGSGHERLNIVPQRLIHLY
ncbi:M24 family metallopeptidase [Paenarthrobacter sp. NPDC090520]|uniref:M24 family metallopeptidase n=1 Tax=Paenarthrobacter sp. NPDC090520 TaxID=3364382 RepID=UPI00382C0F62